MSPEAGGRAEQRSVSARIAADPKPGAPLFVDGGAPPRRVDLAPLGSAA